MEDEFKRAEKNRMGPEHGLAIMPINNLCRAAPGEIKIEGV